MYVLNLLTGDASHVPICMPHCFQALFWALVLLILVVYVFGVPGDPITQQLLCLGVVESQAVVCALLAKWYRAKDMACAHHTVLQFATQVLFAQAVNDPDVRLPVAFAQTGLVT